MPRLPDLKRTPVRGRHPLVYGAAFLLLAALAAFVAGGMVWALVAAGLAVVMAIGAIAVALRGPGTSG